MRLHIRPFRALPLLAVLALLASLWAWRETPSTLPVPTPPAPRAAAAMPSPFPGADRLDADISPSDSPPSPAPAPQPTGAEESVLASFISWTQSYLAADAPARPNLVGEGARLAEARKPVMTNMIRRDPRRALAEAVRPVVRQDLPDAVTRHLEEWVSQRGEFHAYFGRPQPGVVLDPGEELVLRYLETPGRSYKAHVYGDLLEQTSTSGLAVSGVALGRDLAVHESPVRRLDPGERLPPAAVVEQVCPVSGITNTVETTAGLTVEEETPLVELAGRWILLCDGSHVRILEEAERQASGGPGGANAFRDTYPGTSSEAIGNFRCLYIRVTYPDQMRAPNTELYAYNDMRNVSRFYLESSFGRLTTTSVVTPLVVLPHTKAWYIEKDSEVDGLGLVHSDARTAARRLGYDSGTFNCTIVRVNEGPRLSGISWGGGDSVWVSWDGMDVLNHECGHSLGRNHANFWQTSDGSAIGLGANQEYGNSFDVMGGGGGFGAHYNTISKRALGWLSDPYVHRPGTTAAYNGVYRLHAYDQPQLEEGRRYSLRVDKDPQRRFVLEYHPAVGGQWTDAALLLLSGLGSNAGHLVDTTPGSPGGKGDGGIQVGRTFSDFESDLHFTVLGKIPGTPPALDLAVMRGPFPGNQPPTVSLAASASAIAPGGTVTFTATASDPGGDSLAYHWDFNDGQASSNTTVFTRAFPSTDQQTIHLTVSDLKGATARAHAVLTIGNPGRGVVTGRILSGGLPLPGVRVSSDTSKYAYTDSDGIYALSDLQAGARTLTASLAGYTFTPVFANPLAVVAGTLPGGDWTAVSTAELSLAVTDAAEGGAIGSLTLARTGDTASALDVFIAPPGGTAVKTTDYTFSPDSTTSGSLRKFTIPAGQASLVVTVTAVDDTAQEGPETLLFQPAPGAYQVRRSGLALLTLTDNDTTKPVVSLSAPDFEGTEGGGDSGSLLLHRTGSTAAGLSVNLTAGGTATAGADYGALPQVVLIPAGSSSLSLPLLPMDDTLQEPPEDALITLASGAAYVVSTTEASATVTLTDNDLPTVTVSALDDTLSEGGRDPGVVLVTRTGDLTQPLTVYYGLGGRALHGTDYQELPGQVVIPAGLPSAAVILTPYDDGHGEVDESITFSLTLFNNTYSLGHAFSATLNLRDNQDPPLVTVTANSAGEPASNGTFTFTATGSVAGNITLRYVLEGTASAGVDYTAPSGTVTLAGSGSPSATVSIPVRDDADPEDTETVVLRLLPDPAYVAYNDARAVMRLKDDDAQPLALSTHSASLAEPSSASSFHLSRPGTNGTLVVNYEVQGTATPGADYTALPGTAVLADGDASVDIPITPLDDTAAEGTETITLRLLPGDGYGVETGEGTLYLADNDSSAMASVGFLSATGTTTEGSLPGLGEYRDIEVTLSAAQPGAVTAEFMAGGGSAAGDDIDWSFADAANGNALIQRGLVTFAPGVLSRLVRIRVPDDGVAEGPETVILELRNVNGARLSSSRSKHTLTVQDADTPRRRVSFMLPATVRGEGQGGEPLLMAVLDRAPLTGTVSVAYGLSGTATPGVDFQLAPGTLTFAAGETLKPLPLVLLNDNVPELSETVVVTLHSPVNADLGPVPSHTVTLTEANMPIVRLEVLTPRVGEGGTEGRVRLTRTGAVAFPLTVNILWAGTAINGEDVGPLPATVDFPLLASTVELAVPVIDDSLLEPEERLDLQLLPSVDYAPGAEDRGTLVVLDNDSPPLLTLLAPLTPSVAVPSGVGLVCQAAASRETLEGPVQVPVSWSQVSGPGPVQFEAPQANGTGVTFPSDGIYRLRVSAGHSPALSSLDLSVSVGASVLPMRDIGTPLVPGRLTVAGATHTLRAAGTGVSSSGTSDGFYFASLPVEGDFDVQARVAFVINPGGDNSCRLGIMARESFAPNARYAFSFHRATGEHGFQYRQTAGVVPGSSISSTRYSLPRWIRLTRAGDSFAAYYGADGTNWTQRGTTQVVAMGASLHLGLALTSAVAATPSTVEFDSLNFQPVPNLGPSIVTGPALAGAGPWTASGTVVDDALPLGSPLSLLWSTVGGAGQAVFVDPVASVTPVHFPFAGSYTLRLTADDGHTATFRDLAAAVTGASGWESWRVARFSASDLGLSSISGEVGDPDGDGIVNLIEYALGQSPHDRGPMPMGSGVGAGGLFTLLVPSDAQASDVRVQLEANVVLGTTGWTVVTPVSSEIVSVEGTVRLIRHTLPGTPGIRQFYRLRVNRLSAAP